MANYTGRKVRITLEDDGSAFEGYVRSLDKNTQKLSLSKVINCETGTKLLGLQQYFGHDIASIDVLEEVAKTTRKTKAETDKAEKEKGTILRPKYTPSHLSYLKHFEPSKVLLKNKLKNENEEVADKSKEENDTDEDIRTDTYCIISKIGELFFEAMSYLSEQKTVGISLEGSCIGRDGKLYWIQVGTSEHLFMFDVLKMGKECFEKGLKDLLEDEDILKVFHDCRLPSDLLYHQYNINLVNVFDTQVAAIFVYKLRHHGDWPRYVFGLAPCLVEHLNLDQDDVNFMVVRENSKQTDEEVWAQRPAVQKLVDAALKNVMYLLELRHVLMERMMEEFVAGVNIYLTHARDASAGDAKRYQAMAHLLPVAFQDIRNFMVSFAGRYRGRYETKDKNGFRENCNGIVQDGVNFSHDSLWHAGVGRGKSRFERVTQEDQRAKESVIANSKASVAMETEIVPTPTTESVPSPKESERTSGDKTVTPGDQGVLDIPNNSSQLSGSRLMKALVREQGAHNSSSDSELDHMVLRPAGSVEGKSRQNKTSQHLPRVKSLNKRNEFYTPESTISRNSHQDGNRFHQYKTDTRNYRHSTPSPSYSSAEDVDEDEWETREIIFNKETSPSDTPGTQRPANGMCETKSGDSHKDVQTHRHKDVQTHSHTGLQRTTGMCKSTSTKFFSMELVDHSKSNTSSTGRKEKKSLTEPEKLLYRQLMSGGVVEKDLPVYICPNINDSKAGLSGKKMSHCQSPGTPTESLDMQSHIGPQRTLNTQQSQLQKLMTAVNLQQQ